MAKKNGRPSRYKDEYVRLAEWMARNGLTNDEIANELGIHRDTFYAWKKQHKEFADALKKGREDPDDQVEKSLFERACGYEYDEVKTVTEGAILIKVETVTKFVHPDVTACIFWLKNRRPERWRDRQNIEANIGGTVSLIIPPQIKNV